MGAPVSESSRHFGFGSGFVASRETITTHAELGRLADARIIIVIF